MAEIPEGYAFPQTGETLEELFGKLLAFVSNGGEITGGSLTASGEVTASGHRLTEKASLSDLASTLDYAVKRMQGRADKFDVTYDPVKHVEFQPADGESAEHFNHVVNEYIDSLHGNNEEVTANGVPQGLVCLNVWGGRIWLFNTPLSYADDIWAQIAVNALYEDGKLDVGNGMWHRHRINGEWQPWTRFIDSGETDSLTARVSGLETGIAAKAEAVDVAQYITTGSWMPQAACYHFDGTPIHARDIEIQDTDFIPQASEGDITECTVFCRHDSSDDRGHGAVFYAFTKSNKILYYVGQCTYANAPHYLRRAFGEDDGTLCFDNPVGSDRAKEVYEEIASQLTAGKSIVSVSLQDYSGGFEIVDENDQWYNGFAYRTAANRIRIELYGADESGEDIRAWIAIERRSVNGGYTYTSSQGYYMPREVADASRKGLMSSTDKSRLDTMYQYGKSKGWWS